VPRIVEFENRVNGATMVLINDIQAFVLIDTSYSCNIPHYPRQKRRR
jgi:hypothetical protein